jgi:hypothetical protein
MAAQWSLSGVKRTHRGHRKSVAPGTFRKKYTKQTKSGLRGEADPTAARRAPQPDEPVANGQSTDFETLAVNNKFRVTH